MSLYLNKSLSIKFNNFAYKCKTNLLLFFSLFLSLLKNEGRRMKGERSRIKTVENRFYSPELNHAGISNQPLSHNHP